MRKSASILLMILFFSCSTPSSENVELGTTDESPIAGQNDKVETFSRLLHFANDSVLISVYGEGSIRKLRLECSANQRLETEIEGIATNAYYSDLDGNGKPEIYVICVSPGSGSYGNVIVYDQRTDGLGAIRFPSPDLDNDLFAGYMGHDSIFIRENRLIRQFPVYRGGDANAAPTGGYRKLSYRLSCIEDSCAFMITSL